MKRQLTPRTAEEAIKEAQEYFENAKETLKRSPIEFGAYKKAKYVKEAAGMCYLAALQAIDSYLLANGRSPDKLPASIEEYREALKIVPHNGKLKVALRVVYENLHILAYYRGGVGVNMIKEGFMRAKEIIDTFAKLNREGGAYV